MFTQDDRRPRLRTEAHGEGRAARVRRVRGAGLGHGNPDCPASKSSSFERSRSAPRRQRPAVPARPRQQRIDAGRPVRGARRRWLLEPRRRRRRPGASLARRQRARSSGWRRARGIRRTMPGHDRAVGGSVRRTGVLGELRPRHAELALVAATSTASRRRSGPTAASSRRSRSGCTRPASTGSSSASAEQVVQRDHAAVAGCDRTTDWHHERASWGCDFQIYYSGPMQFGAVLQRRARTANTTGGRPTTTSATNSAPTSARRECFRSTSIRRSAARSISPTRARPIRCGCLPAAPTTCSGASEGSVDYTLQSLDVAGGRLFTAHLTQGQVVYHLNLRTFVRAILQYTDITRDPALYVVLDPRPKRAGCSRNISSATS